MSKMFKYNWYIIALNIYIYRFIKTSVSFKAVLQWLDLNTGNDKFLLSDSELRTPVAYTCLIWMHTKKKKEIGIGFVVQLIFFGQ